MPGQWIKSEEKILPPSEVVDIDAQIASTDYTCDGLGTNDKPLRAISIGTAGDIKIDTPHSTGVTIDANALAVGVQHVIAITKVYKTGTAATEVWGWR